MLQHENLLFKIALDTAENEPPKVTQDISELGSPKWQCQVKLGLFLLHLHSISDIMKTRRVLVATSLFRVAFSKRALV